jgi:threonine dehydratase
MSDHSPGLPDVVAAARRLRGRVRHTALERSLALGERAGAEVLLKLECQQRTGSFKLRGALNALALQPAAHRGRPVVTASAGNHGLGVAVAARELGIGAVVFVPAEGSATKRERIRRTGAEVRPIPGGYDAAHREAEAFAARTGAVYVHAYSDPAVVAGQGTVGWEMLVQRPDLRVLLVPVGGGGLIGGVGIAARMLAPGARVIGVQSTATRAMHASLAAGRVVSPPEEPTLCDGLAGDIDATSLALAQQVVDDLVLVPETAIGPAVRFLLQNEGILAEPSAAVVAALLLEGSHHFGAGPIGAVISGGNVDASTLKGILATNGPGPTSPGAEAPTTR